MNAFLLQRLTRSEGDRALLARPSIDRYLNGRRRGQSVMVKPLTFKAEADVRVIDRRSTRGLLESMRTRRAADEKVRRRRSEV
jgi:hypothetical protein